MQVLLHVLCLLQLQRSKAPGSAVLLTGVSTSARPRSLLIERPRSLVSDTPPPPVPPRGAHHPTPDTLRLLDSLHTPLASRGNTVPRDFMFQGSDDDHHVRDSSIIAQDNTCSRTSWWKSHLLPWHNQQVLNPSFYSLSLLQIQPPSCCWLLTRTHLFWSSSFSSRSIFGCCQAKRFLPLNFLSSPKLVLWLQAASLVLFRN